MGSVHASHSDVETFGCVFTDSKHTIVFDDRLSGVENHVNFFSDESCFVMGQPDCIIKYDWIDRRIETSYVKLDQFSALLITKGIELDDLKRIRP